MKQIGIFDSGLGGLSVLKTLLKKNPQNNYIYFADSKRNPYGEKSPSEITAIAIQIVNFLLEKGAEEIIIACNTVSTVALKTLNERYDVAITGTVEGAIQALKHHNPKDIGLLATTATVRTGIYEEEVAKAFPKASFRALAAPAFTPLVEQGELNTEKSYRTVADTLRIWNDNPPSEIILGCTHYPFLQKEIQKAIPGATLINPAEEMGEISTKHISENGRITFYTSGDVKRLKAFVNDHLDTEAHPTAFHQKIL